MRGSRAGTLTLKVAARRAAAAPMPVGRAVVAVTAPVALIAAGQARPVAVPEDNPGMAVASKVELAVLGLPLGTAVRGAPVR